MKKSQFLIGGLVFAVISLSREARS